MSISGMSVSDTNERSRSYGNYKKEDEKPKLDGILTWKVPGIKIDVSLNVIDNYVDYNHKNIVFFTNIKISLILICDFRCLNQFLKRWCLGRFRLNQPEYIDARSHRE